MILGIFASIGRWIRSIFMKSEGQIEAATDRNLEDPFAIEALYRRAEAGQSEAIDQLANVVGMLEGNVAQDEALLKRLVADCEDGLERFKDDLAGAYAVGEDLYAKLSAQGKTEEQIQADEEFQEAMEFAQDMESTIAEREQYIANVKERLEGWRAQLSDTDSKLKALYRRLQNTKQKGMSAKAEAIVASQMDKLASLQAGINLKGTDDMLRRADEAVARMSGRAKAKQRLAGMDDTSQRDRFRAHAQKRAAGNKFMERVRGTQQAESESVEPEVKATEAAATEGFGKGSSSGPAPLI